MRDVRPDLPVPGDLIWIRRRQWRVRSAHAGSGLTRVVVDGQAGRGHPAGPRTFLLPCERWSSDATRRRRNVSAGRALAWLAGCAARTHQAFTPCSIVNSAAALLAYQLEPALAMLAGKRRLLIADDVGLGKTIQAALIVAETLQRSEEARVLVVAPASLVRQWCGELRARFGVNARTADAESFSRLRSDLQYLNNPWHSPGVWVASPDYLKQPHVIEGLPRKPFDVLVIDEAHLMAGNSQRHSAVDDVARAARQVILLTATPHDGDETRFRRLMALGATGSPADSLTIFRRTRTNRARRVRRLAVSPGADLSQMLAAIDSFGRAGRSGAVSPGLLLICAVFRKRALSSLAALEMSLQRRLAILQGAAVAAPAAVWVQPGLRFDDGTSDGQAEGDVMPADEWSALRGATGLPTDREQAWLQRLLVLATRAKPLGSREPKLARLTELLRRSKEPVVVFTEYRDSLLALAAAVAGSRRIAVLHGGLTGSEQRRALDEFLDGHVDTLLATDVASQGLNLQHRTRWVVHFDLPWTPMRLEQRAGRVDRIGQTRPVHLTAIGVRHPAERAVRLRVAERQDAGDAAPLTSCTRWTRAAEGLARWFARQRALAARWRGPEPVAVPQARVTATTMRRLGLDGQTELRRLVEIPFVTNTGEVIERRIGWVAGAEGSAQANGLLVRRARALTARARRCAARVEAAQAGRETEAAVQPGLFDARLRDAGGVSPAASPAPGAFVHVGQPRPLLVLYCSNTGKDRRA